MNFAGGRGNVTVSAEYNKGGGLVYNDRAVTATAGFYGQCNAGSQFNQCLYPDGPWVNATTARRRTAGRWRRCST